VLQVAFSYLNFHFPRLRPLLNGEPVIVVQDGKAIERNLKRERLTLDDVAESARLQGIGSLEDVAWGVLETSGTISFIKKNP
jgi:uncharacterized membrane protein YcaP (DUF421 family)